MGLQINLTAQPSPAALAVQTLWTAATHALTARVWTQLSPLTGGIYGAALALSQVAIGFVWDQVMPQQDASSATAKWAVSFFASFPIASIATSMLGYPISSGAAIVLSIKTMALFVGGLLSIAGALIAVGVAALAIKACMDGTSIDKAIVNVVDDECLAIIQPILRDAGLIQEANA